MTGETASGLLSLSEDVWPTFRLHGVSTRRLCLCAVVLAYAGAFHLTYRDLVAPQYASWGAGYRSLSAGLVSAIYCACLLPALLMPIEFKRPSQLFLYVQYFLVFIPSAFLAFFVNRPDLNPDQALSLLAWMTAGMLALQIGYFVPIAKIGSVRLSPRLFWAGVVVIGLALFAYMASVLRGNFRLVSLADVYDVRSAMGDLIAASGSSFVTYAQLWLGNLFLPLAFAAGIYFRRRSISALALLGYLFIFGVSGQKVALMAIVYLPSTYWLLRHRRRSVPEAMGFALSVIVLAGYAIAPLFGTLVSTWYIALLNFRTFTIQGINLSQYYAFFLNHPVTNLSHLSGIRWFVHYPYELDIPFTLGYYFYDAPVGNNSGMWATDAIGGFGSWAIPFVSMLASGVFWLVDSVAHGLNARFVALTIAYIAATLANVSLGTTLLSGGIILLCIGLALMPRVEQVAAVHDPSVNPLLESV